MSGFQGNPMIPQGTLNRLRGSIIYPSFSSLNVTAPYLGKGGIRLAFEGQTTLYVNTLTGAVTSPEPYQLCMFTINLLKTQGLAAVYEAQRQLLSTVGEATIKADTSTLPDYLLFNCSIENVRELDFSGEDAGYVVSMKGYYPINNSLWNLV